jgi:2-hydroxymuconate-semialdehyde hydrolase
MKTPPAPVNPFTRLNFERRIFEGFSVGCWAGGRGPALLLLHGSGPGASSIGNWRTVLDELAKDYRVLAVDLIGFGTSDRKPAPPYFDFPLWCRQARWAVGELQSDRIAIVGHSISAALALKLAASDPRVTKVATTGAMGSSMAVNPFLDAVWRCPADRAAMADAARVLIHDPRWIDDAYLDARMAVIGSDAYRTYFNTMFAGPFDRYIGAAMIDAAELSSIRADVIMLHGRNDVAFPSAECSEQLAPKIANADLHLLSNCSHSVALERSDALLPALGQLLTS